MPPCVNFKTLADGKASEVSLFRLNKWQQLVYEELRGSGALGKVSDADDQNLKVSFAWPWLVESIVKELAKKNGPSFYFHFI